MLIKINNYEILNFAPDTLLYTKSGITRLNSPNITSLLSDLENLKTQILPKENLENLIKKHNLEPQEAFSFLMNTNTLQNIKNKPHYSHATLYLDWKLNTEIKAAISETKSNKINIEEKIEGTPIPVNESKLFIITTLDLHPIKLRKFYFEICNKNPESAFILGYYIEDKYHLSQPFIPVTGNPCAFCSIDKIRNMEKLRPGISQWAKVLDFCFDRTLTIPRPTPTILQRTLILGLIQKKINLYTSLQDPMFTQDMTTLGTTLNLESGEITDEAFPHWSMCQCLRMKP